MTRTFSPVLRHALAQAKRLAYGHIEPGEAVHAWDAWKGRYSYIREHYGSMVFTVWMLVCEYGQAKSTWRVENPKRARNQADVCALLKAVLAMIEGDIVGPEPSCPSALWAPPPQAGRGQNQVLDFKSRAAGERDEPGLF